MLVFGEGKLEGLVRFEWDALGEWFERFLSAGF